MYKQNKNFEPVTLPMNPQCMQKNLFHIVVLRKFICCRILKTKKTQKFQFLLLLISTHFEIQIETKCSVENKLGSECALEQ